MKGTTGGGRSGQDGQSILREKVGRAQPCGNVPEPLAGNPRPDCLDQSIGLDQSHHPGLFHSPSGRQSGPFPGKHLGVQPGGMNKFIDFGLSTSDHRQA